MHGVKGGLAAGLLFVLPGAAVMLALPALYAALGEVPLVAALFFGLKCAALVPAVEALLRVARRALKGPVPWPVAAAAFLALYALQLPIPLVVLAAALAGYLAPTAFAGGGHGAAKEGPPPSPTPSWRASRTASRGRPPRRGARGWSRWPCGSGRWRC